MTLRAARPSDAPAIAALHNRIIRDTAVTFTTQERTPEAVARQIAERIPAFLVAETAGRLAGFATYGPFRAGPGYAASCEHTVILDDAARGRGLGRALMTRAIEEAWARPIARFWVHTCTLDSPAALGFYRRSGFTPVFQQIEIAPDPRLTGILPRNAASHIPVFG